MPNSNMATALANDWEYAYRHAVEMTEGGSGWPFEVVGVEIAGQQVWPQAAPAATEVVPQLFRALSERLEQVEVALNTLVAREVAKDWYSTGEVAIILGKAEFTVREWCRNGRV